LRQKDPGITANPRPHPLRVPTRRQGRRPAPAHTPGDAWEWIRNARLPGERGASRRSTTSKVVFAFCEQNGGEAPFARLRDRRPWVVKVDDLGQAGGDGIHVARTPLGDRVQVPARGKRRRFPARTIMVRHRPYRPGHAVSRCSSPCSSAWRSNVGNGDAAQRGRCRPARTVRPGDTVVVPARGGERDSPEVVGPVIAKAGRRRPKPWKFPKKCPELRATAREGRGRGEPPLRSTSTGPGPSACNDSCHWAGSGGAMDIEGMGGKSVVRPSSSKPVFLEDAAGRLRAHGRPARDPRTRIGETFPRRLLVRRHPRPRSQRARCGAVLVGSGINRAGPGPRPRRWRAPFDGPRCDHGGRGRRSHRDRRPSDRPNRAEHRYVGSRSTANRRLVA